MYTFYQINDFDTNNFIDHLIHVELKSAIKQFGVWILIGSVVFFYIIWRKAIDAEQSLREENLKFKYRSLKNQVNPHFLFNSLNTLSEIVYEDPKTADDYIQKLSSIYRYILENENNELISLENELQFVLNYFNLQEKRDRGRIQLEVNVDDRKNYLITPVSIQLLVENAVKHNAMSDDNPLIIKIKQEDQYIAVHNNKQKKSILENSTKTGLQNLNERIRLFLNRELKIIETDKDFLVKVPIIKVKG